MGPQVVKPGSADTAASPADDPMPPQFSQQNPIGGASEQPVANTTPIGQHAGSPATSTQTPIAEAKPALTQNLTNTPKRPFWKRPKLLALVLLTLLLGGGGAAAYFGYYEQHKPENKLLAAIANSYGQDKVTVKGNWQYKGASEAESGKIDFSLASDSSSGSLALAVDVDYGKQNFPVEARAIDKNLYFKIDGAKLADIAAPNVDQNFAGFLEFVKKIKDQWYVLSGENGLLGTGATSEKNCFSQTKLSAKDKKIFQSAYKAHQPLVVKSVSQATVDGQSTTKYEVAIAEGKKLKAFLKKLEETSQAKEIKDCYGASGSLDQVADENSKQSQPFNLYVSQNNQIKKVEANFNNGTNQSQLSATFDWGKADITKPEDARPAEELLGELFGAFSVPEATSGDLLTD